MEIFTIILLGIAVIIVPVLLYIELYIHEKRKQEWKTGTAEEFLNDTWGPIVHKVKPPADMTQDQKTIAHMSESIRRLQTDLRNAHLREAWSNKNLRSEWLQFSPSVESKALEALSNKPLPKTQKPENSFENPFGDEPGEEMIFSKDAYLEEIAEAMQGKQEVPKPTETLSGDVWDANQCFGEDRFE